MSGVIAHARDVIRRKQDLMQRFEEENRSYRNAPYGQGGHLYDIRMDIRINREAICRYREEIRRLEAIISEAEVLEAELRGCSETRKEDIKRQLQSLKNELDRHGW